MHIKRSPSLSFLRLRVGNLVPDKLVLVHDTKFGEIFDYNDLLFQSIRHTIKKYKLSSSMILLGEYLLI